MYDMSMLNENVYIPWGISNSVVVISQNKINKNSGAGVTQDNDSRDILHPFLWSLGE